MFKFNYSCCQYRFDFKIIPVFNCSIIYLLQNIFKNSISLNLRYFKFSKCQIYKHKLSLKCFRHY